MASSLVDKSVVRIESDIMIFNWTQPYKTPSYTKSTGTGTIIDKNGNILTCAHVIENSSSIRVSLPAESQEKFPATIVSCCPNRDLAIINVQQFKNKNIIKIAKNDTVNIGSPIKVLGYPLSQTRPMLTAGIIGGLNNNRYQIDAQINPGNSGGPLLDQNNQMVGVVDSIIYSENLHTPAISRAIPISSFNSMSKIALSGKYKLLHNPKLGVIYNGGSSKEVLEYINKKDSISGALARYIFKNSILEKYNVKEGDIITEFNKMKVNNYGECTLPSGLVYHMDELMNNFFWNDTISLQIWESKNDKLKNIDITIDDMKPLLGIRTKYPCLEQVDYLIFRGLVIMELTNNHLSQLEMISWSAINKVKLLQYKLIRNRGNSVLIVTQILPETAASLSDTIQAGELIDEVDFQKVYTLSDFRNAVASKAKVLIKTKFGAYMSTSINDKVKQNEKEMAIKFNYPEDKSAIL